VPAPGLLIKHGRGGCVIKETETGAHQNEDFINKTCEVYQGTLKQNMSFTSTTFLYLGGPVAIGASDWQWCFHDSQT
jgi:hypothetical protein